MPDLTAARSYPTREQIRRVGHDGYVLTAAQALAMHDRIDQLTRDLAAASHSAGPASDPAAQGPGREDSDADHVTVTFTAEIATANLDRHLSAYPGRRPGGIASEQEVAALFRHQPPEMGWVRWTVIRPATAPWFPAPADSTADAPSSGT